MKTLLSILARNVHHRAQLIAEAYLRRLVLRQGVQSPGNHRHSFYATKYRAGQSYFKRRR